MTEKKLYLYSNGAGESVINKNYTAPVRLWKKLQINEWTFSCLLFLMSLSIVLGKLYINYGNIVQLQNNSKYMLPTSMFSNIPNVFDLSYMSGKSELNAKKSNIVNEKFVNTSQYDDALSVMTSVVKTYGWLIKAAVCGLCMMGFTWFIIYKDSSIPGINPPSPFSPSNQRFSKTSRVQVNYLIGVLNGILIFVYMCL